MHKLTVVQFEDHERRVLAEAANTLTAIFDIVSEEGIEAHKKANGVAREVAPIPRGRLETVYDNYVFAVQQFQREAEVEHWVGQIEGDPGDPENPLSTAHMAHVLAEARGAFLVTVQEALKLLEKAIEASSTDIPKRREVSV